jgi:hypothetical protein
MSLLRRSRTDSGIGLAALGAAFLLCLLLLMSASCTGADTPAGEAGQLSFDTTDVGAGLSGTELSTGVLPSIPLDADADAGRAASDLGDPEERTVLGSDFVVQWSGEVQETALYLDPALEEQGERPVAFGMYKVGELAGKRPLEMTVQGSVGEGQQYFVAIANYARGHWQWFGPATGDFTIDFREHRGRYVSRAGNMYFLVVAHNANTVLHSQTTVLVGPAFHDDDPGFPVALRASDGEFPAMIKVQWMAGEGAVNFELFRATPAPPGQRPDWVSLGFTEGESWEDTQILPDKIYIYKVRAINEGGESAFSNVDHGYAGEAPPPPQQFQISGRVVQKGTDNGLPGIKVFLIGAPGVDHLMFETLQSGEFGFNHLPAGAYIVFPQSPQLEFEPKFLLIGVNNDHPHPHVKFEAVPGEHKRALWGFVYTMGGPAHPGLIPLRDVPVRIKRINSDEPPAIVNTNELGFWVAAGLENGDYDVRPLGPPDGSVKFFPDHRVGHIDGEHITPALWFRAELPPPGGDGGGGPGGDGGGDGNGGGDNPGDPQ